MARNFNPFVEFKYVNDEIVQIITYHDHPDCDDYVYKNEGVCEGDDFINYMKIKTYDKNCEHISTEKKRRIIPKSVIDETERNYKKEATEEKLEQETEEEIQKRTDEFFEKWYAMLDDTLSSIVKEKCEFKTDLSEINELLASDIVLRMQNISDNFKNNNFVKNGKVKETNKESYFENNIIFLKTQENLKKMRDDFFKIYKNTFLRFKPLSKQEIIDFKKYRFFLAKDMGEKSDIHPTLFYYVMGLLHYTYVMNMNEFQKAKFSKAINLILKSWDSIGAKSEYVGRIKDKYPEDFIRDFSKIGGEGIIMWEKYYQKKFEEEYKSIELYSIKEKNKSSIFDRWESDGADWIGKPIFDTWPEMDSLDQNLQFEIQENIRLLDDIFINDFYIENGKIKITDSDSYFEKDVIYIKKDSNLKKMRDAFWKTYKNKFIIKTQHSDFDKDLKLAIEYTSGNLFI